MKHSLFTFYIKKIKLPCVHIHWFYHCPIQYKTKVIYKCKAINIKWYSIISLTLLHNLELEKILFSDKAEQDGSDNQNARRNRQDDPPQIHKFLQQHPGCRLCFPSCRLNDGKWWDYCNVYLLQLLTLFHSCAPGEELRLTWCLWQTPNDVLISHKAILLG